MGKVRGQKKFIKEKGERKTEYSFFMPNSDSKFMKLALELACKGGRDVAPNPMVGAVIVKNGKIIGKGYHQKFGGPHAEVNAIRSVKNPEDLKGATIYVTLEPCRHYGKTPPCLDLIEKVGISRVICGSRDPFQSRFKIKDPPAGRQGSRLKIIFLKGNIAEQCRKLNKFFFTWVRKKRPFVTVKVAISADGFVAGENGEPVRITNRAQDCEIHKLRAQHQTIMVGINTVLNDDPQLNVRLVKGKDPLRVILDSDLRIPSGARVLKDGNYLVAINKSSELRALNSELKNNIWVSPTGKQVDLKKLLKYMGSIGISSVLVESGPTLYRSLKKQGLIDELIVYRGRNKLGKGLGISL